MRDDHPDFFRHVEILVEASRLDPTFESRLRQAANDDQIDGLVDQAKAIIEEHAEHDFV
jgi:hypothetical protein